MADETAPVVVAVGQVWRELFSGRDVKVIAISESGVFIFTEGTDAQRVKRAYHSNRFQGQFQLARD